MNATSRARLAGASLFVFLLTGVLTAGPGPLAVAPPTMPLVLHHVDLERYEEIQAASDWFSSQRVAPGDRLPRGARVAAVAEARTLSLRSPYGQFGVATPAWAALGPQPVDTTAFDDPSNGSVAPNGFHDVSGRVTALAVNPSRPKVVYLGTAAGGIWKTRNGGRTWRPIGDRLDSLSVGAIAIDPTSSSTVYAGTGETNAGADSYYGAGIFRSTDGGATWVSVGGDTFDQAAVLRIAFGATSGQLFAATSRGLYRSSDRGATWQRALVPAGKDDPTGTGNVVTDVVSMPGSTAEVVAAVGWRAGGLHNGLYVSHDGGATFMRQSPSGFPHQANIGRMSLAVTASQPGLMYAVIQDALLFSTPGTNTVLNGVYKSTGGPKGPWKLVATSNKLAADPNSALNPAKIGPTYQPGIQAWYNQAIAIDPTNPDDVVLGLEEVYDTKDGGITWQTIGRYWNACLTEPGPAGCFADPNSHPTTHPDQHAAAFGVTAAGEPVLFVGNDGGVWSQAGPEWSNDAWSDRNAGLAITQPYSVAVSAGPVPVIYAGTRDNGTVKYTGSSTWDEVFGGDGGEVAVEPNAPNDAWQEYVYGTMAVTTDGGKTWTNGVGPPDSGSSINYRFIAPFVLDPLDPHHVVVAGRGVWDTEEGAATSTGSWTERSDNGAGRLGTALAVRGSLTYEAWCGPCNPSSYTGDPTGFARGLATNVGGSWHRLSGAGLPNRYVTSIAIDPTDARHVYVTLSGFSGRWVEGAGEGHVFESTDGGGTFRDISADLPDAPANDSALVNGQLFVATDVGVFQRGSDGSWFAAGTGLPNSSVLDLTPVPGAGLLVAATHGRGVWQLPLP